MGFITLKELVEKQTNEIITIECSYCGRKLSQIETVWIGCCPLCKRCYKHIKGRRKR